jgi:hypothetical protein
MNAKKVPSIADWINDVNTAHSVLACGSRSAPGDQRLPPFSPPRPPTPPIDTYLADDQKDARSQKRRRAMEDDLDQTPRPSKRARDLDGIPRFPPSPTKSTPSAAGSEASEVGSHRSGRLSPVKQLQLLEDEDQPVVFCNFDDDQEAEEPADVTAMRSAIQQYADGMGILGYDDVNAVTSELMQADKMRFKYPWANDPGQRCVLGSMPPMVQVQNIVETARKYDRGAGVSENEWNSEVQNELLKLARSTSRNRRTLDIHNV